MNRLGRLTLLLVLGLTSLFPASYGQDEKTKPETSSALAMGTGGGVGGKTIQFSFRITKYTSDEEVDKFAELLKEKGPDALRRALEKEDVGRINPVGRA